MCGVWRLPSQGVGGRPRSSLSRVWASAASIDDRGVYVCVCRPRLRTKALWSLGEILKNVQHF